MFFLDMMWSYFKKIGTFQIHALGSTYKFATVVEKIHGNYREKSLQLTLRILHNNDNDIIETEVRVRNPLITNPASSLGIS